MPDNVEYDSLVQGGKWTRRSMTKEKNAFDKTCCNSNKAKYVQVMKLLHRITNNGVFNPRIGLAQVVLEERNSYMTYIYSYISFLI